ncbi:MAG: peptide/nickel transport system permease protein, partial [Kribbellaceae bacterium]|nr:peptide/nickel transport system permease protein [Kribbellaceae bacterium]
MQGAPRIEGRSLWRISWTRLKRDKVAMAGAVVVGLLILMAIFAPLIVKVLGDPPNAFHQDLIDTKTGTLAPYGKFGGISWHHLMGLEPVNGRDIFSRVVYGSRISLLIAFFATLLSVAIGTTMGVIAGFFGGWVDAVISRLMDIFLAFPLLVFAIALAGVMPDDAFGLKGNTLRVCLL